MIVKIQRPLAVMGDTPSFLIYDEERSFQLFVPVDSEDGLYLCHYFDCAEDEEPPLKVYVWASITKEVLLTLAEPASDQDPGW